jgi:hypothetical protein
MSPAMRHGGVGSVSVRSAPRYHGRKGYTAYLFKTEREAEKDFEATALKLMEGWHGVSH